MGITRLIWLVFIILAWLQHDGLAPHGLRISDCRSFGSWSSQPWLGWALAGLAGWRTHRLAQAEICHSKYRLCVCSRCEGRQVVVASSIWCVSVSNTAYRFLVRCRSSTSDPSSLLLHPCILQRPELHLLNPSGYPDHRDRNPHSNSGHASHIRRERRLCLRIGFRFLHCSSSGFTDGHRH